jgi:2-polyprenyl-6-hydroxyphenyl methylase/3-demethylubiquinone-9 3-methyltransferase
MTKADQSDDPASRTAYAGFAERYATFAPTKAHNALYERPATMALLGEVAGLRVLDAGCGPGICSELLAKSGATVHAFDITLEMVELARKRCANLPVEVSSGDLAAPLDWLKDQSFDAILCSLALDYVQDLRPVFREFKRVARQAATLVFSMGHPMRDWTDERTRRHGTYFDTARFGLHWSGFGEPKPYVEAYRRPLSDIINALVESGWLLERFVEPRPLAEMKTVAAPLYAELSQAPAFICVRARC